MLPSLLASDANSIAHCSLFTESEDIGYVDSTFQQFLSNSQPLVESTEYNPTSPSKLASAISITESEIFEEVPYIAPNLMEWNLQVDCDEESVIGEQEVILAHIIREATREHIEGKINRIQRRDVEDGWRWDIPSGGFPICADELYPQAESHGNCCF